MEVVVTAGVICRAKLQSNHHHQQTNIQFFYRPDVIPVAQPTVSRHRRGKYHIPWTCLPQTGVFQLLSLTTNSSWLPWGKVAMPLISPLMPVPLVIEILVKSVLFDTAAGSLIQTRCVFTGTYTAVTDRRTSASSATNSSPPPSACAGTFRGMAPTRRTGVHSARHSFPPTAGCCITGRSTWASCGARRIASAATSVGRLWWRSRAWTTTWPRTCRRWLPRVRSAHGGSRRSRAWRCTCSACTRTNSPKTRGWGPRYATSATTAGDATPAATAWNSTCASIPENCCAASSATRVSPSAMTWGFTCASTR